MYQLLSEGLRKNDLQYLVGNKIHFDEFDSKMGEPADVITISFKIKQRMPSQDLVNFIENGYDWVMDADVSTGEIDDGEYLVFVEVLRKKSLFKNIIELLGDLQHLTDIKPTDWKFKWYKLKDYYPLTEENLNDIVPNTASKYKESIQQFQTVEEEKQKIHNQLSQLKKLSGIE
jgi:hypothetical protein